MAHPHQSSDPPLSSPPDLSLAERDDGPDEAARRRRDAVPADALAPPDDLFDTDPFAEPASWRLQYDAALVTHLARAGFSGQQWEVFKQAVLSYGLDVVRSMIQSGAMFYDAKRIGRPVPRGLDPLVGDDLDDVVTDTVIRGFQLFERNLHEGRWTADRGASLRTYYVNGCIREFPNVYRALERSRRHAAMTELVADVVEQVEEPVTGPEESVLFRAQLEEFLAVLSEREGEVLILAAEGYGGTSIAEHLNISSSAVYNYLDRAREKLSGKFGHRYGADRSHSSKRRSSDDRA